MAKILKVTQVRPFTDNSPKYSHISEVSLPLTFCDTQWFKFPPTERLFFYSLAESKETLLNSVIPKLKHSLSLTLHHYLPASGTLTWPRDSPTPVILYRAPNNSVSFSIAESETDLFDILSCDDPREACLFRSLVPMLDVSEIGASVLSLQITLFPKKGICIGVTSHHAVLDGKSSTMFIKSWAHMCRDVNTTSLPKDLTPFFDRSVIRDPRNLAEFYLNWWMEITKSSGRKNDTNLFQFMRNIKPPSPDLVRATFKLSIQNIAALRNKISLDRKADGEYNKTLRLSTFVVALSHILRCIVNSSTDNSTKILFGITADYRCRLKPPVPENYFGNCIGTVASYDDLRSVSQSLAAVANSVARLVGTLEGSDDVTVGAEERRLRLGRLGPIKNIGVTGSPRFGVYSVNFGWEPPRKVEVASTEETGTVSLAESRESYGGIEVGVVLKKHEMDVFATLFKQGL